MDNNYHITISNRNIYREAVLAQTLQTVRVGTATDCEVRLRRDWFFEPIEITFVRKNGSWSVLSGDNLYFTRNENDLSKLRSMDLQHGDSFGVHYSKSGNQAFIVEFTVDFDDEHWSLNRYADLTGRDRVRIGGGMDCDIILNGKFAGHDTVELIRSGDSDFRVDIQQAYYGTLHDGKKAVSGDVIKSGDFLSIADNGFYIKNNRLWMDSKKRAAFQHISVYDAVDRGTYPKFQRNSRVKIVPNMEKIQVLDPAQKPQKPKNNLLLRLLPSVGMLLAAILMASLSGSRMIVFSLVTVSVAVITAILTVRQNNRDYKEGMLERQTTYQDYIARKRAEIEQAREQERVALNEIYLSVEEERRLVHNFSPDLFDRTKDDDDFICIRLGTGDLPALREIDYKSQEALTPGDELQQMPEMLSEEYRYVRNVPVTCDLKSINALGIIGAEPYRFEFMKVIVTDLAVRQFHSDVSMIFVAREEMKERIRWLRFLPNVYNERLGIRNLVMNDEGRNQIFEYLYQELTAREQAGAYPNRILVFLYDAYGFQNHPVSRFISKAKELGVTFVFFGEAKADIPVGCGALISLNDASSGYLVNAEDRNDQKGFAYPHLSTADAVRIVELLAPVCTDEVSLEGSLTKSISLFELLHILSVEDLDLIKIWSSTDVTKSMAAPIGVTKTGQIALDLHDKAHGPHGLVAGTTGSGKSELLQTYILSMALRFHPYEVGFMIIDFKGGGMANQFEELPHLMGTITNIDGKEIARSLKSIKAELQKRQRYFAAADVNHIDKYIEKYKKGEVKEPLPHLVIIVDEFAELKAEQPEFMKELISAARIGRSLGVHLILATQKPAGQVNEQIWSNSRFKLCLKVQSQEDSKEVLKSPLAAEIKEPGRAYLQVGNNEIFELIQSAYSGAPERGDDSTVKELSIVELTDSGKRRLIYEQKKARSSVNRTQLEAAVEYVRNVCEQGNIAKLADICLPPLETTIVFPALKMKTRNTDAFQVDIGVYDDPDRQYQGVYSINLTEGNTIIIGSSRSGKTNILQSMIRGLALNYSPSEVNIYIIDFASLVLKNFEGLNHVGGVVTPAEDEKLRNLFKLLSSEIESRKEKLLLADVSSFRAYLEAGRKDIPQIVVMIDNLSALQELYFQDDEELLRLCREGLPVGISVVVANAHMNRIGYRYLSSFANRMALFCNDSNEYNNLFDHCRMKPDEIPGRSIIEVDKENLECQAYLAFEGVKEIERVEAIHSFVAGQNEVYGSCAAALIPVIPEVLTEEFAAPIAARTVRSGTEVLAGLNYATVSPVMLDLAKINLLAVSGRPGMGQGNFLKYLVRTAGGSLAVQPEIYIVDSLGKRLQSLKEEPYVRSYEYLPQKALDVMNLVREKLQARYDALSAGNEKVLEEAPLLVIILNNPEVPSTVTNNSDALSAFREMTGRLREMKVCIIVSSFENAPVNYSSPEVSKKLKENGKYLLFDDLVNMKFADVPIPLLRTFKKPVVPGDAYLFSGNECAKLKTVFAAEAAES